MHRLEAYIRLAVIFVVLIGVIYLPVMAFLKRRGVRVVRQIGYLGLFCAAFLIVFATILFVPITLHPEQYILNLKPFGWIGSTESLQQFIVEKIPNIMLFIPFGFFLPTVFQSKRKWYKTAVIAFFMTFGVEFVQYFIGRSADIDDVITNLLGAMIGYSVFNMFCRLFHWRKWWNALLGNKT